MAAKTVSGRWTETRFTKMFQARLPKGMFRQLDHAASHFGKTRTEFVIEAIREKLERTRMGNAGEYA